MLICQIPDPSEVIHAATGVSWEAGMVAVILVACMGALVYMMKRQNDNIRDERAVAAAREDRMANRMNGLEDRIDTLQTQHANTLVLLSKEIAQAMAESTAARVAVNEALAEMARASMVLNGDIKELCSLLKLSPCIALGQLRGRYKIVDERGNEIKLLNQDEEK